MQLKDLAPNPENPRSITEAKQKMLLKALRRFGDLSGIVFNRKTKHLVGGHQRKDMFRPDTPVVIAKKYSKPTKTGTVAEGYIEAKGERFTYREVYWDEATEKAATIAANKGAGEWDLHKLKSWMQDLNSFDLDFDLDLTMFDHEEIKEVAGIEVKGHMRSTTNEKTGVDEDEIPEKVPARSRIGDLYLLGGHRLLCGDSTYDRHVAQLIGENKIDMVFTDPPYNQETSGGASGIGKCLKKQGKEIEHLCDFNPAEFLKLLPTVFSSGVVNAMVFCNKDLVVDYLTWARGIKTSYNILVWKKPTAIPIGSSHRPDVEYLLSFRKNAIWNSGVHGANYSKVLEHSRVSEKVHPTMKPVEMIENQLLISSSINGLVFDPFGGSGSTLIACEKTNRKCFMMEIDPHYCDIIVDRWEKYTGLKAKLIRAETKLRKPTEMAKVRANGKSKSQTASAS